MKTPEISQQEKEVHITAAALEHLPSVDFMDTFSTTNHEDSLEHIVRNILTTKQRWIIYLFQLRNWLAKFFGLQTTLPADHSENFTTGGYVGFFRIYELLPDEVILGGDDSHLDFRLSVHKTKAAKNNVKVTTLVHFHNRLGKIYMTIVAPFHRMIVKRMVAQGYRATG